MVKLALLIGVSEYQDGLTPLPGAVRDVEAMQRVLHQPETGGFDQVKPLIDPDPLLMQQEIEALFCDRSKDDLVLLFFSGHGIKDDTGKLYFATRITRKTSKGELIRSTAVPASFVCEIMSNSRSKRQIVILDCCFSGAFAEDMTAKEDGSVSVQAQLGGEGRAVLTSSTSTQYSFEQKGSSLSVYTKYLVQGIETGEADSDNDGVIAVDELHDYARQRVQEIAPAMKPEIYAVREGFRIRLAKAQFQNPQLRYRKAVEQIAISGTICLADRRLLNRLQMQLGLSPLEASQIEVETLQACLDYQENLKEYEHLFQQAIDQEFPINQHARRDLKLREKRWNLRPEDVELVEAKVIRLSKAHPPINHPSPAVAKPIEATTSSHAIEVFQPQVLHQEQSRTTSHFIAPPSTSPSATSHSPGRFKSLIVVLLTLLVGVGSWIILRESFQLLPQITNTKSPDSSANIADPSGNQAPISPSVNPSSTNSSEVASPTILPSTQPSPGETPSTTSTPFQPPSVPPLSPLSPARVVQQYFEAINDHNLNIAWSYLTEKFQKFARGYEKYCDFWKDYEQVNFQDAEVIASTNDTANVAATVIGIKPDGEVKRFNFCLLMILSTEKKQWLIDESQHLRHCGR